MAILTISREFGSGGKEIGRAVAESMGYEYVDKEIFLNEIKAKGHRWEEWARDLDEHCPTVWEKYDWTFRGFGALTQSIMLEHAVRDKVVIVGRGGNFVLKDIAHALSIRIIAPLEARIQRIMLRDSVDREMARLLAEKTDRDRACFLYAVYGKRWDDPTEYDFVFNTGMGSLDEVIAAVTAILVEREQFKTEEVQRLLEMRAAAARIRAGLLTDEKIVLPVMDVEYDGKDIVLRGIVHNPKEHRRIEEAARRLAGDLPLRCELHYRG